MRVKVNGHIVTLGICRLDVLDYAQVKKEDGTIKGHQFRMNKRQLLRLADYLKREADGIIES